MIFEADRHEALVETAWDASEALNGIRSIVRDIERARASDGHWPVHPRDGDPSPTGFNSYYLGRAGVLWALWYLQREGAVDTCVDTAAAILPVDAAYQADPDAGAVVPSYFLGRVGILLVQWRLTGSRQVADELHAVIRSNIANPTNESLWAAPGTMLPAWMLWEATGEPRWRDLFLENADHVWRH